MGLSGFQLFKPIFKEGCVMLTITCSLCFFFTPLEFGVAWAPTTESELGFYRQLGGQRRRALISLSPASSGPLCCPLQAFALCTLMHSQTRRFPESCIFDSFGGALSVGRVTARPRGWGNYDCNLNSRIFNGLVWRILKGPIGVKQNRK